MQLVLRFLSCLTLSCSVLVCYSSPVASQNPTQLLNATGPFTGSIIATSDNRVSVGEGDVVIIDQGDAHNVRVGDRFLIFQEEADFFSRRLGKKVRAARQVVGELTITETAAHTSKGLIIDSQFEIAAGALLALAPTTQAAIMERGSEAERAAHAMQESRTTTGLAALEHYTVARGDTLWKISGKDIIYNNPFMWPLIYKANHQQIRDPDLIFPQQILAIPRDYSPAEAEAAIQRARERRRWRLRDGL